MKNLKSFLFIISLIFFLNIILFNFSFATLYVMQDEDGNIVMITNIDNVKTNYLELGHTFYILEESKPSQESSESEPKSELEPIESQIIPEPKTKPKADIKIVDWTNYISGTGNYIYVEGILQNISKITATDIGIKIQALDKYGKLISITSGYADPSTLVAKQKAFFSVMVSNNPKIAKFNLTVLWK